MTGLADCNNFFVSCERTRDRSLEGRAVVVLSNNDGCVVARSNEAKRLGVKMGQPAFGIKDWIREGKVTALSGNHLLYREISLKVHALIRRFVPDTIDYSVDESFLVMDGIPVNELRGIGEAICDACMRELHIPVTVGFAPTKTLSKIVTEYCKKHGERVGVVETPEAIMPILDREPIGELWGIGRRLSKRLYTTGIFTIGDFMRKDRHWVRSRLGVTGERSWQELHGQPCIELSHVEKELQESISESRTFPEDVADYDYIRARIAIYAADCARKLRATKGVCRELGVFLRTNPFHQDAVRMAPQMSVKIPVATDNTQMIVSTAIAILDRIYVERPFKRAGVWLTQITPKKWEVESLFDLAAEENGEKSRRSNDRLMEVVDELNKEVGSPLIKLASQLTKGHPGHNDGYSSSFQAPKK